VGRALLPGAEVSGFPTDLRTPRHDGRAEIIPFQNMPALLGGKGISYVGLDTGDLPSQGERLRVSNLNRPRPQVRCAREGARSLKHGTIVAALRGARPLGLWR
jgi:hypothetical protein